MKRLNFLNLGLVSLLLACSTNKYVAYEDTERLRPEATRAVASADEASEDSGQFKSQVQELTKSIFHSYLYGQVLLNKFDAQLDKDAAAALNSDVYSELLAIRTMVDEYEETLNEMYVDLVLVSALPRYSDEQKADAQVSLDEIGKFMAGVTNNGEIPDSLKPLILSNLRDKQTHLFHELQDLKDDSAVTGNDEKVKEAIHKNMVLLRATRRLYQQDLENYHADQRVVDLLMEEESKQKDFQDFQKAVKSTSKDIKKLITEIKGRNTSSDIIFPAVNSSGNITGRGFPANTWSLTYDDGPGGSTTPTVLKNLQDRGLKATFFVLAKQVEALPTISKSLVTAGMDIASHSYTHAQLTKVGPAALEREIGTSKSVIENKLGTTVKLFRLPYGAGVSAANVRAKIAAHKMVHVFWNVDTLDWQDKDPQSIFNRSVKQMNAAANKGGVILFHDIHRQSVTASTLLMDYLKRNNKKVCTVQAVVDQLNNNSASCN